VKFINGEFTLEASEKQNIEYLLNQIFSSSTPNREQMELLGAEMVEMVETVADYLEYGQWILAPVEIGVKDQITLVTRRYDVQAFTTSVDGQVFPTRVGYGTDLFSYTKIDCGFEILWDDLEVAPFDFLQQKIKEAGEELARKRDSLLSAVVATAAASVAGHFPTVSTTMTKASIDSIYKLAAADGMPINRVVINSGTVLDMRTAAFGVGGTWLVLPDDEARQLLRQGYFEYGQAEWRTSHNVASDKVYFVTEPRKVGMTVRKGPLGNASDIDIKRHTNLYTYWEKRANYVYNAYGLYELTIT
jgi:hypothetical protein